MLFRMGLLRYFVLSFYSPHVLRAHIGRSCGAPNETELTAAHGLIVPIAFRYGSDDRGSEAWAACLGVVESEFKSTCEANPNAGYCSFDGILAHDIDAYCTKRAAGLGECHVGPAAP